MCSLEDLLPLYSRQKREAAGSSATSVALHQAAHCSFIYSPAGKEYISDSHISNTFSFFCVDMKLHTLH
jgi:hypothetical protein